jgi:signal transduction histidine kinase
MEQGNDDRADAADAAELGRMVAELREAVRARDDFIAIASHELRNPITPIAGFVDFALSIARRPGAQGDAQLVAVLERLQTLMANYLRRAEMLLDVSRIGSGNLRLEPSQIDLSSLVRAAVETHAPGVAQAGCQLDLRIEDGVVGRFDRVAVEQIVDNLLSNAAKFGAGRPIGIALRRTGGSAELEVRDRGIGISAADRDRIFRRFEQVVSQHRGGGFGVGLWVVGRLVEAMGGEIAVEAAAGEGSTFRVKLPLQGPDPRGTT